MITIIHLVHVTICRFGKGSGEDSSSSIRSYSSPSASNINHRAVLVVHPISFTAFDKI